MHLTENSLRLTIVRNVLSSFWDNCFWKCWWHYWNRINGSLSYACKKSRNSEIAGTLENKDSTFCSRVNSQLFSIRCLGPLSTAGPCIKVLIHGTAVIDISLCIKDATETICYREREKCRKSEIRFTGKSNGVSNFEHTTSKNCPFFKRSSILQTSCFMRETDFVFTGIFDAVWGLYCRRIKALLKRSFCSWFFEARCLFINLVSKKCNWILNATINENSTINIGKCDDKGLIGGETDAWYLNLGRVRYLEGKISK